MAARYDDAPEVAPHIYPEAVPTPPPPQHHDQQQQYYAPPPKQEYPVPIGSPPPTTVYTAAGSTTGYAGSHHGGGVGGSGAGGSAVDRRKGGARTVCGCTLIVFVLSVIIAVLAAGVIGLAAGTGIEASRASEANEKLQRLQSSVSAGLVVATATTSTPTTTTSGAAAATSAPIDNGCSENANTVSGQQYTSFKLLSLVTYTMRCNKDVNGTVLYSLFSPDFNTCMDSCSGYTKYATEFFGLNVNATCAGVSFIPLWTDKAIALKGGAPGNCYLKRGPLESKAFIDVNIGTPVHGAMVIGT